MNAARVSSGVVILWLLAAAVPAWAQPRNPPPPRVSSEAASRAMGGPTLITLHFKDVPPLEVFRALVKQAGMALYDDDVRDSLAKKKPITVDFDKQPFWVVVRSLTAQLELDFAVQGSPNFWDSESGWILALKEGRDPRKQGPAVMSGSFLVMASSVARSAFLTEAGGPDAGQQGIVEFVILVDPKLHIRGQPRGSRIEVTDDRGKRLKVEEVHYSWTQEVESRSPLIWSFKAEFELPAGSKKLARFKAVVDDFVAATSSTVWEVADPLKAKNLEKDAGSARFSLQGITRKKVGSMTEYAVSLASGGLGEETDFGWPPRTNDDRVHSVRLVDVHGQGFTTVHGGREGESYVIEFAPVQRAGQKPEGEPAKLIWDLPTEVVNIEVPFEFKDLPLP